MLHVVESSKPLDRVAEDLQLAVGRNKFGVLGIHDLRAKMAEKGVPFARECRIFEVCNPHQAARVLEANLEISSFDGPIRAVRCALAIRDGVRRLGIEIRAGVHSGECEVVAGKIGGIAAIIGARVKDLAKAGEVLATSTVRDLVSGSRLTFAERGAQALKGVPGEWRVFLVTA
jgi:hypothetical protein